MRTIKFNEKNKNCKRNISINKTTTSTAIKLVNKTTETHSEKLNSHSNSTWWMVMVLISLRGPPLLYISDQPGGMYSSCATSVLAQYRGC